MYENKKECVMKVLQRDKTSFFDVLKFLEYIGRVQVQ